MIAEVDGARTMQHARPALRADVQALRGIAVLVVVAYHAHVGPFQSGYLGVDIFFVISGFLITSMVAGGIARSQFSLRDFYVARARRLLPAAYAMLIGCSLAAPFFLGRAEAIDLIWQQLGTLTYTANFVLLNQTGYFAGDAEFKPLLHMWSLSIEEQYYFLLPALLLLVPRKHWLRAMVLLFSISLLLCIVMREHLPDAAFYLLPSRAWEMALGSLGALWVAKHGYVSSASAGPIRLVASLRVPAAISLAVAACGSFKTGHPGWPAAFVCCATLVILVSVATSSGVGGHLNTLWSGVCGLVERVLAWFGDWSYSLYLAHWPVVAFAKNAWVGEGQDLPGKLNWLILVCSLVTGYALYAGVERRFRYRSVQLRPALIFKVLGASACIAGSVPLALSLSAYGTPEQSEFRSPNFGLSATCEYTEPFVPRADCIVGNRPSLLLWGDSYAMHLASGLRAAWPEGFVQATRSSCAPLLGASFFQVSSSATGHALNEAWAQRCIEFNDTVLQFALGTPEIRVVVLSSPWLMQVTPGSTRSLLTRHGDTGAEFARVPTSVEATLTHLKKTVERLRQAGKRVILVAPPPSDGTDFGRCWERMDRGQLTLGANANCSLDRARYEIRRAHVLRFLDAAEASLGLTVLRFEGVLCGDRACATSQGAMPLYRDAGHFTKAGAESLAMQMNWSATLQNEGH